jgi:mannose-1-phosphate guanylyltransferase
MLLLTPSDHGVADQGRFLDGIRDAIDEIRRDRSNVVLFGVAPVAPASDYGWIVPQDDADRAGIRPVSAFVEKPDPETASELFAGNAVWNTMVLASRARALFDLFRAQAPGLASVFSRALTQPKPERDIFLRRNYDDLPVLDFSRDILGRAKGLSFHTWPASMGWSDLGTPDRLEAWHRVQPSAGARMIPRPARADRFEPKARPQAMTASAT